MKIAIVGSGNMGGGLGKLWAKAGHEVVFSYSRNPDKLQQLAVAAGNQATVDNIKVCALWLLSSLLSSLLVTPSRWRHPVLSQQLRLFDW
ncbi:MAG TPA: hypothetical protein DDZ80_13205 [Cyanobacteria bacterium UBA8803]|nr:hypothetical protein [Cyanobacteria bacterium UBA9273]HBL59429.1 hypothetical protein [Cyanobacteria bacterium UBA8803]